MTHKARPHHQRFITDTRWPRYGMMARPYPRTASYFRAGGRAGPGGAVIAKYGFDPGAVLYTHMSSRYGPLHTRGISATTSEAILDGLHYFAHQTDLRYTPFPAALLARAAERAVKNRPVTPGSPAPVHRFLRRQAPAGPVARDNDRRSHIAHRPCHACDPSQGMRCWAGLRSDPNTSASVLLFSRTMKWRAHDCPGARCTKPKPELTGGLSPPGFGRELAGIPAATEVRIRVYQAGLQTD